MNAPDAREHLEAMIRRALARAARSPLANADVDAILDAADAYRHAPPPHDRTPLHLAGVMGAVTACQYSWSGRERVNVTGNPALISCGHCKRSRLYRDLTAGRAA